MQPSAPTESRAAGLRPRPAVFAGRAISWTSQVAKIMDLEPKQRVRIWAILFGTLEAQVRLQGP